MSDAAENGCKLGDGKALREKVELSERSSALFHVSVIAVLILLASFWKAEDSPDTALFLMVAFVFLGLYIFLGVMEITLLRNLIGLRASLVAWIVLFTYFAYVAKAKAMSDINSIFHMDATLLPMTLVATTALQVLSMLFWPVLVISVLILIVSYFWRKEFIGEHEGLAIMISLVVSAIAQLFFAGMIWGWVGSNDQRKTTIYRLAHFADFNSSFRCENLDETKFSVLFIDPARTQVIIAPKIPELILGFSSKATWLQPVKIPREFPQKRCLPFMNWQESEGEIELSLETPLS